MWYIEENKKYYDRFQKLRGVKKMDWRSKSYLIRFRQFLDIGSLESKTILDVGCGRRDLMKFLKDNRIRYARYVGVDIYRHNPLMEGGKDDLYFVTDILQDKTIPKHDYVFASGVFGLKKTKSINKRMIRRCFSLCNLGFAFNMSYGEFSGKDKKYKNPELEYYNPYEVFGFCRKLCRKTKIRFGYLPHDFTIFMKK